MTKTNAPARRIRAALSSLLAPLAVAGLLAGGTLLAPRSALAQPCPTFTATPGLPADTVEQQFPASGPMRTAWRVRFAHATGKGLYVTGAWFKKSPNAPWMRVLWDARLADIFVPYHPGTPRYYDLTNFNFPLVPATAQDAGPCGKIIDGKVIHEVASTGVLWKDDQAVAYGQELALWATLDSANYNYIMRYGFRDDGTIALRLGATSRNLPGHEYMGHMHNGLWRIDMDLNGASADSAFEYSHVENTGSVVATDGVAPFNGGKEGGIDVNPLKFTEVHVRDASTNAAGKPISYEFRPVRFGAPRHEEPFAHHDFWVTRYHGSELLYDLPALANGESVTNGDLVVWHISPLHHDPRDEDGHFEGPLWKGVALLMWGGVDIRPRNLFDGTPMFP
ncbi:Cu2+-containing amine oxidase [Caulobacter sp. AP07]|uniref:copper amine oxidase n=1 Tax=Caulobacter sp. AP07 TaxID=1144304 RepID=UPI00027210E4|nr:hypothetical protein [Caulobacter sp. AP07]EJL36827.1 Cu2+-containing amine oxidase [Caulobacter sp. AP07]